MAGEAARVMVVVGADVSSAVAALRAVDGQVRATAASMDENTRATEGGFVRVNSAAGALSGGLSGLMSVAAGAAGVAGVGMLVVSAAKAAWEMGNLGEQVLKQRAYFDAYSGGAQEAAKNLDAMKSAIGGAMTESEMMGAASQLLSMGLAKNAEELARLSEMAVLLGGTSRTASESINEFAMMLANQSVERLDTFGISSGNVRERINELMEATKGLSREQAFLQAVMETGAAKVNALKAAGVDATTQAQDLAAAWRGFREEIGKEIAPVVIQVQRVITDVVQGATERMAEPKLVAARDALVAANRRVAQTEQALLALEAQRKGFGDTSMGDDAAMVAARLQWAEADVEAARAEQELAVQTALATGAINIGAGAAANFGNAMFGAAAGAAALAGAERGITRSVTAPVLERPDYSTFGSRDLSGYHKWLADQRADNTRTANLAAQAYASAMQAAASKVQGYVSDAISKSKGLYDVAGGGKDAMAPGANGPFENVYRALAIAKDPNSEWAGKLGMDQATAKRLTGQFQQGLLTPEVISKLIDVDALVKQAQLAEQAEKLTTAFAEAVVKAAGTTKGVSVVKAMLGGSDPAKATGTTAKDIAAQLKKDMDAQASVYEGIGKSTIDGIAKGAQNAKGAAVTTVTEVAQAMIDAMQATLKISSPSQVFAALGYQAIMGLGVGAGQATEGVTRQVRQIAEQVIGAAKGARLSDLIGSEMRAAAGQVVAGSRDLGIRENATMGSRGGMASSGGGGRSVYVAGDNFTMLVGDGMTAAMTAAMIGERKRERMAGFMGG